MTSDPRMTPAQISGGEAVALEACPFCGSEARKPKASSGLHFIACTACGVCAYFPKGDAFPADWNRRAALSTPATTGEVEQLREALRAMRAEYGDHADTASSLEAVRLADEALAALPPRSPVTTEEDDDLRAAFKILDDIAWEEGMCECSDTFIEAFQNCRDVAALPPSSGWEAGAEAMREAAVQAVTTVLPPHTSGPGAVAIFHKLHDAMDSIRALPLPPPPSSGGA